MRNRIAILILGVLLSCGGLSRADVVQLDLSTLGMPTNFNNDSPSWQTNFDLGVTFTEISHVYIDWSGDITAALAQNLNPAYQPIGDPHPLSVGVYASLGSNPYLRRTEIYKGMDTYPAPESFALISEIGGVGSNWSDLLDGQGEIGIGYTEIIMLYGQYLEHGSVSLTKATLVVNGTVIPEPASLLLLAFGTIGQRLIRPKQRNKNSVQ